jgi:hypothetical protein
LLHDGGHFLAARDFEDFDDLNRQTLAWYRGVANQTPKPALGIRRKRPASSNGVTCGLLPDVLPPVCEVERVVDLHGYVSVDTNRCSLPERSVGQSVAVHKLPAGIHAYHKGSMIAGHQAIGERDAMSTLPGHHAIPFGRTAARQAKRPFCSAIKPARSQPLSGTVNVLFNLCGAHMAP